MNKINTYCTWLQIHWLFVVIVLTVAWMLFLFIVGTSWVIGYWCNAIWGMKFQIESCWQGISIVLGGFVPILGLAKAGWEKYKSDSEFNSDGGKNPYDNNRPEAR